MVQMGEGRIVGGDLVPIENVPYIISMRRLGSHRCGGSIITTTRVLSAAHCTVGIPGTGFEVRAGRYGWSLDSFCASYTSFYF